MGGGYPYYEAGLRQEGLFVGLRLCSGMASHQLMVIVIIEAGLGCHRLAHEDSTVHEPLRMGMQGISRRFHHVRQ